MARLSRRRAAVELEEHWAKQAVVIRINLALNHFFIKKTADFDYDEIVITW